MPALDAVTGLGADLALLCAAAEEAGSVALRFWRNAPDVWEKADEQGPVSEADLAVDDLLRQRLLEARPDFGWVSEESETLGAQAQRTFIVDPIDGTRAFLAGERSWAVALAIVSAGRVEAGVVHLPAHGRTYAARRGGGATRNGLPIQVSGRDAVEGAQVLAAGATMKPALWHDAPPSIDRHFRPSLAYRLALVAEGRFDAMLTLRDSWQWDIAAGALLVEEAGGTVLDRDGAPLRFGGKLEKIPGVVAAPSGLAHDLTRRMRPAAA